jgi:hypothetical protein
MNAQELFRIPLNEFIKRTKRNELFRHVLFEVTKLEDPLEPGVPFIRYGILPQLEREMNFRRDAVPPWITLKIGKAARDWTISGIIEERTTLPSAEHYRRIKDTHQAATQTPEDPSTWPAEYAIFLKVPPEVSGMPIPLSIASSRARVLTHPVWRDWFFDDRVEKWHREEALEMAKRLAKGEFYGTDTT